MFYLSILREIHVDALKANYLNILCSICQFWGGAFLVQSLMFSSKYYFEFNAKPCCAIISVMFSLFIIISNIVIFEPGLSR